VLDDSGNIVDVVVDSDSMKALDELADASDVEHYRDIFTEANRLGLTVFLTLYHWPLPLWLHDPLACRDYLGSAALRGWLDEATMVEYAKYAAYAGYVFGDLVDLYATINEAPIVAKYGYLHERVHFPPGKSDVDLFLRVFRNLSVAHGLGYSQVKKWDRVSVGGGDPAVVGVVTVLEQYDPADPGNPEDCRVADFNNYLWNRWNLNADVRGDYDMDLDGVISADEHHPELVRGCDFIGADYYLRERVRYVEKTGDPRFCFEFMPAEGYTSDTGWEIYPDGLGNVLRSTYGTYGLPIYVTENGVADSKDRLRVDYMRAHLEQVHDAIQDGVDVRGYFYWSLLDNYSWFSGYRSRFGLYSVDMMSKERTATSGVEEYRRIALGNRLD